MTSPATAVDLAAVERDIAAILVAHGLTDHDTVQVSARIIEQAGQVAGVTVDAFSYTRPTGLPTTRPAADPLGELTEDLEAAS